MGTEQQLQEGGGAFGANTQEMATRHETVEQTVAAPTEEPKGGAEGRSFGTGPTETEEEEKKAFVHF